MQLNAPDRRGLSGANSLGVRKYPGLSAAFGVVVVVVVVITVVGRLTGRGEHGFVLGLHDICRGVVLLGVDDGLDFRRDRVCRVEGGAIRDRVMISVVVSMVADGCFVDLVSMVTLRLRLRRARQPPSAVR
jgi:hypothetical protein